MSPVGPEPVTVTGEDAVEVKDPVKLQCSAVSVPAATYTWKFNGTLTDVKTAEYTIGNAVYKNTGTYTCEAYNAVTGKTSTSSHKLSVKGQSRLFRPKVRSELRRPLSSQSERVELC